MGNTFKTGNYVNGIFQDASNNIGIGAAPSGTYKLEVTGTARVSGAATFSSTLGCSGAFIQLNQTELFPSSGGSNKAFAFQLSSVVSGDFAISSGSTSSGGTYTPRLYINPSGNVGIGTSSPSGLLELRAADNVEMRIGRTTTADYWRAIVYGTASNTFSIGYNTGAALTLDSTGVATFNKGNDPTINLKNTNAGQSMRGTINWYGADSSNVGARIFVDGENSGINSTMYFYTKNSSTLTERMRITNGGNVLINTTTDSGANNKLQVAGTVYSSGSVGGYIYVDRSTSTGYTLYGTGGNSFFFNGSANIAQISMTTGVYTPLSNINKKKDFELSTIGLNAILGLKPTLYRIKTEDETFEKHLGFIAQEVKEFIPQAYVESGEDEDKFIGLDYQAITATLVKAIQEQQATITSLQDRLSKGGL